MIDKAVRKEVIDIIEQVWNNYREMRKIRENIRLYIISNEEIRRLGFFRSDYHIPEIHIPEIYINDMFYYPSCLYKTVFIHEIGHFEWEHARLEKSKEWFEFNNIVKNMLPITKNVRDYEKNGARNVQYFEFSLYESEQHSALAEIFNGVESTLNKRLISKAQLNELRTYYDRLH